ncbi:hypothetical protein [Aurantiacibacter marinus]|uniref:DUF4168 domain-containing protein n=1 Tax=Aurantiacibacter marinus TaxID=874156 RepID=A0A0H0XMC3_9SPHN|nr:hypothetical protein [Aurantiacibacter marinus]KLI63484.1 hypothetical protein AAV99_06840 [Aurantiacibacter marinus]
MKPFTVLGIAAALAIPTVANAQDTQVDHEAQAEAPVPVTDEDLAQYAALVLQGRRVQNSTDMSDAEKQAALLQILTESEMGLARFTAVSEAIRADEALQARMQQEVIRQLAGQ